jgi:hypothetical protein
VNDHMKKKTVLLSSNEWNTMKVADHHPKSYILNTNLEYTHEPINHNKNIDDELLILIVCSFI